METERWSFVSLLAPLLGSEKVHGPSWVVICDVKRVGIPLGVVIASTTAEVCSRSRNGVLCTGGRDTGRARSIKHDVS